MNNKYFISAEGTVDEKEIEASLKKIGLSIIFVEKIAIASEMVAEQTNTPLVDAPDLWTRIIESKIISNRKLLNVMKEYDAAKLTSSQDIAEAIVSCCNAARLSDTYTGIVLEKALKSIG